MLSPHEFATPMLVKAAREQIDLNREELDTLLERQVVALEQPASGAQRPRLTRDGVSVLRAVARKHRAATRPQLSVMRVPRLARIISPLTRSRLLYTCRRAERGHYERQ